MKKYLMEFVSSYLMLLDHNGQALFRSSYQRCSMWKSVFRNFTKFTRKHLCQNLFLNKVLSKKRLWHRCFPVNFAGFLRTLFLQNISGRLVLFIHHWSILREGLYHRYQRLTHSTVNSFFSNTGSSFLGILKLYHLK